MSDRRSHRPAPPPASALATPQPAAGDPPRVALWLLTSIIFSGTLAMHMFVPALTLAARDLAASTTAMQMTVSVYVFGLAVGQLAYGPLSDRFGRRPVLMGGLALYTAAGLASVLSLHVDALIVARLFQALGGSAGMVLGRAIVRDTARPEETARRLALMNLAVVMGPGIAPLIGSGISYAFGWRVILDALFLFGIVNLLLTWRLLPETGRPASQVSARAIARNYGRLLCSPAFLGYAIGGACATSSMYAFIAAAPFIFVHELHQPVYDIGVYLAMLTVGMWLGSVLANRLILRIPLDALMVRANLVSVVASFVLLGAVLTGHLTVALAVGPMFVFSIGVAVSSPAALTQSISVNPHAIGSASGLYGSIQMIVGAVCAALAGVGRDPALAAAVVLAAAGIVGQVSFAVAIRRRGRA